MSDAIEEIRKRWDVGMPRKLYSDADVGTLLAEIDRLAVELDGARTLLIEANRKRGEACEELASAKACHASVKSVLEHRVAELQSERDGARRECDSVRKVREAAEAIAHHAETATYPLTFMNGAAYRRSLHVALRAALDSARGEGGSHE
jgi:DNA-binding transcriptional MerR regulator